MTSLFKESNPLTHKEQVVLREIGNGLSSKKLLKNYIFLMAQFEITQVQLSINYILTIGLMHGKSYGERLDIVR